MHYSAIIAETCPLPMWLHWFNVLVEALGVIISMIIFYYAIRSFLISRNNRHLFWGMGFLLLGLSFALQTVYRCVIWYPMLGMEYSAAMDLITVLFLLTAYSMFMLAHVDFCAAEGTLMVALVGFITYVSFRSVLLFNIAAGILLLFILSHTYNHHKVHKKKSSLLVFISFILIALAHMGMAFQHSTNWFNLISNVFLLAAFILILYVVITSGHHEKKKNRLRNH